MLSNTDKNLAVIGAGVMGRGIAQLALQNGFQVKLFDVNQAMLETAQQQIFSMLEKLHAKSKLTDSELAFAKKSLICCQTLAEVAGTGLVIEAIAENLTVKQSVFAELESIVDNHCVIASNTSSLSITSIATNCQNPKRIIGIHFFNPVPLMKIVEIIPGLETSSQTVEFANQVIAAMGHQIVNVKDAPGFLVNHAGRAYVTESTKILSENIANVADIDKTMKSLLDFKMGPLELMDLTGLDITFAVMESIYEQFHNEPRLRPTSFLKQRVEGRVLGRKTEQGFYHYLLDENNRLQQQRQSPKQALTDEELSKYGIDGHKVWIDCRDEFVYEYITQVLSQHNIELDKGETPDNNSLVIALPLFEDLTSYINQRGFIAKNTVAVDLAINRVLGVNTNGLADLPLTIMTTPATTADCAFSIYKLFVTGQQTLLINDSPSFIAPRILAVMINNACEIAQQQITTPADINKAVKVALGYPKGLLDWGDELGSNNVLAVLQGLYSCYQDPRYRPSLWLKRRASLGLSLLDNDLI